MMIDPSYPHLIIRQQCQLLSLNRSSLYYAPKIEQLRPEQLDFLKLVDETYTRYPFFGTRQTVNYLKNKEYGNRSASCKIDLEKVFVYSIRPFL
jgi:putative transposase